MFVKHGTLAKIVQASFSLEKIELKGFPSFNLRIAAIDPIRIDPNRYFYFKTRTVSALETHGPNDNGDGFEREELIRRHSTFANSQESVDHNPEDVVGMVVDTAWVPLQGVLRKGAIIPLEKIAGGLEEGDVVIGDWVENIHAMDREVANERHPGMIDGIINGEITDVSMGCFVEASICSACGNVAHNSWEYCSHVPSMKGKKLSFGRGNDTLVYEINQGVTFFEDSVILPKHLGGTAGGQGADPDAHVLEILTASKRETDLKKYINVSKISLEREGSMDKQAIKEEQFARESTPLPQGADHVGKEKFSREPAELPRGKEKLSEDHFSRTESEQKLETPFRGYQTMFGNLTSRVALNAIAMALQNGDMDAIMAYFGGDYDRPAMGEKPETVKQNEEKIDDVREKEVEPKVVKEEDEIPLEEQLRLEEVGAGLRDKDKVLRKFFRLAALVSFGQNGGYGDKEYFMKLKKEKPNDPSHDKEQISHMEAGSDATLASPETSKLVTEKKIAAAPGERVQMKGQPMTGGTLQSIDPATGKGKVQMDTGGEVKEFDMTDLEKTGSKKGEPMERKGKSISYSRTEPGHDPEAEARREKGTTDFTKTDANDQAKNLREGVDETPTGGKVGQFEGIGSGGNLENRIPSKVQFGTKVAQAAEEAIKYMAEAMMPKDQGGGGMTFDQAESQAFEKFHDAVESEVAAPAPEPAVASVRRKAEDLAALPMGGMPSGPGGEVGPDAGSPEGLLGKIVKMLDQVKGMSEGDEKMGKKIDKIKKDIDKILGKEEETEEREEPKEEAFEEGKPGKEAKEEEPSLTARLKSRADKLAALRRVAERPNWRGSGQTSKLDPSHVAAEEAIAPGKDSLGKDKFSADREAPKDGKMALSERDQIARVPADEDRSRAERLQLLKSMSSKKAVSAIPEAIKQKVAAVSQENEDLKAKLERTRQAHTLVKTMVRKGMIGEEQEEQTFEDLTRVSDDEFSATERLVDVFTPQPRASRTLRSRRIEQLEDQLHASAGRSEGGLVPVGEASEENDPLGNLFD
jgi:hypothetical protein